MKLVFSTCRGGEYWAEGWLKLFSEYIIYTPNKPPTIRQIVIVPKSSSTLKVNFTPCKTMQFVGILASRSSWPVPQANNVCKFNFNFNRHAQGQGQSSYSLTADLVMLYLQNLCNAFLTKLFELGISNFDSMFLPTKTLKKNRKIEM